jgi:phosphoribosylaminoimidazole carboxylase (NCAIR synthetase)
VHVSLIGGIERLMPMYRTEAAKLGIELRIFNTAEPHMTERIAHSQAVIVFTGQISHKARIIAVAAASVESIPLLMCHSCGICALRRCLLCCGEAGQGGPGLERAPALKKENR